VRPVRVVVIDKNAAASEDEDSVEAVGAKRAYPAFGIGVCVRRLDRCADHLRSPQYTPSCRAGEVPAKAQATRTRTATRKLALIDPAPSRGNIKVSDERTLVSLRLLELQREIRRKTGCRSSSAAMASSGEAGFASK
jgi:hypothetical protein